MIFTLYVCAIMDAEMIKKVKEAKQKVIDSGATVTKDGDTKVSK